MIGQLGGDDPAAREAAARKLLSHGEQALPALEAAAKSKDAEVRRRAAGLLRKVRAKVADREADAALAELEGKGLGWFVGRMVADKEFATEPRWAALDRLVRKAAEAAVRAAGDAEVKALRPPALDLGRMSLVRGPTGKDYEGAKVLLNGSDKHVAAVRGSTVLSSGSLREGFTTVRDSVLVIDGDLGRCTSIMDSVVICRGEIGSVTMLVRSLILTARPIGSANGIMECVVQTGGVDRCTTSEANVYINTEAAAVKAGFPPKGDRHVQLERSPLDLLRWEPARKKAAPSL